ncbi:MAG: right-handed parallel beta-helix repeat-containing protein, partial [Acidobacteriota bacterium]
GTPAQPMVGRAAVGARPRVVADTAPPPDGINLEGADWIVVEGFRVEGRTRAGLRAVLCSNVVFRSNVAVGNGRWGILTGFCDDLLIENNTLVESVIEHGVYVSNSGDRPVVRGNLIVGNHANGIHMNGDLSAGGDGVISDALIENNVILDNGVGGGSGINCDGVQDSTIRNNLIADSHASGISLYRIDGGAPSTGNVVVHNTIVVAADGRWGVNIRDASTGNTVRNNAVYSEHGFRGAFSVSADSLPGFSSDHNAVEDRFTLDDGNSVLTLVEWRSATGQDLASVAGTPAAFFADPAAGDFHLRPGSPALDLGEDRLDVLFDLDGRPRPLGAGWDAGAFEGAAVLFVDGFESGGLGAWSASTP